jgi:hypothetical protein
MMMAKETLLDSRKLKIMFRRAALIMKMRMKKATTNQKEITPKGKTPRDIREPTLTCLLSMNKVYQALQTDSISLGSQVVAINSQKTQDFPESIASSMMII